jgi:hypothetical protein
MSRGRRIDSGGSVFQKAGRSIRAAWQFIKKRKAIFIPAGAGVLVLASALFVFFILFGGMEVIVVDPEPSPSPVAESPAPTPSPAPPEPSPSPEPPAEFTANPLTGLPLNDEEAVDRRPIAVVHNNSHNPGGRQHALPMYGIGQADVIYEVMAEGNITRMLAFYKEVSDVPKIGAVRSARSYYVELALAYDAVIVHAGGSPQSLRDIPNWGVNNINSMNQPATHFWRDVSDRPNVSSEHTLFTSGERLMEIFETLSRQKLTEAFDPGLHFNGAPPMSGDAAASVRVPFSSNKSSWFFYNEDDGLYYMEQYNEPFIDGSTGGQLAVTNVLVINTSISVIRGDTEGRLDVDLRSGGGGYYIANGQYIPIRWSRGAHDAQFRYSNADGEPLELLPGKTFVCVIPTSQTPVFE